MSSTAVRTGRQFEKRETTRFERKPSPRPRWKVWAVPAALALVLLVYGPGLNGPFAWDDLTLPFRLRGYGPELWPWLSGMRPVTMLSYWVNFRIGGLDPFSYHLLSVLLHFCNSILVFTVFRRLLEFVGESGSRRDILAGFAGALFLLHPLGTEAVTYITGRSDVLSAFFFLAAFALFVSKLRQDISIRAAAGIVILFGFACLSKESAAVFPAIVLLTGAYWNRERLGRVIRRHSRLYAMVAGAGLVGALFVWRVLRSASSAGFGMADVRWPDYLFTQWRVVWLYVQLFLLPAGQSVDHDILLSHAPFDAGAITGLAVLIAAAAMAWRYRRRFPLACYGLFVFLILLAPTSSFIPIRDLAAERRAYLPMIGLLLIAVDLLRAFISDRKALATASAVLCAFSAIACYERNQVWSSEVRLWTDAAEKAPDKARPRAQLAYALLRSHRCLDSVRAFGAAARLAKPDYALLVDWAAAYDCARDPNAALEKYQAAAQLEPRAHAYSQIGRIYLNAGRIDEALAALNKAASVDAKYAITYLYRGMAYSAAGDYTAALRDFRLVLALDPSNADAARALSELQAHLNGLAK